MSAAANDSKLVVIYLLKLKDVTTFDPMSLLEILKQSCATITGNAGFTCKAYQEKETYSNFYLLTAWRSTEAEDGFRTSEAFIGLSQFINSLFTLDVYQRIANNGTGLNRLTRPIIALQTFLTLPKFEEQIAAATHEIEDYTDCSVVGGSVLDTDSSHTILSAWKSVRDHEIDFKNSRNGQRFSDGLRGAFSACTIVHLEVNQFI